MSGKNEAECKSLWWEDTTEKSGILCAGYFCNMPQHKVARDGIAEWVILYCAGGRGLVSCNRQPAVQAQAGMLFCLPAGVPHAYSACPQDPWQLYWFHCTGILALKLMQELPVVRHMGFDSVLPQNMGALLTQMEQPAGLLRTVRCRALAQLVLTAAVQPQTDSILEQARRWLEQHCEQDVSVSDLAARFGLSEYHFIRAFHAYAGRPPRQYQMGMRVQRACTLLEQTTYTVAQISERLGYASPYYFSRQFKLAMGCAPRDYRRRKIGVELGFKNGRGQE